MNLVLPFVAGVLVASGFYLMMRHSTIKLVMGLTLLSHAAHLVIFITGGLDHAPPPLIPENQNRLSEPYADPLPQALILTAIVISFGVLAFTIALACRTYQATGADDLDDWKHIEE